MVPEDPMEKRGRQLRASALALAIPSVMGISPLIGYGLGYGLDRFFGTDWIRYAGLVLGLAAGVRAMLQFLRELNAANAPKQKVTKEDDSR